MGRRNCSQTKDYGNREKIIKFYSVVFRRSVYKMIEDSIAVVIPVYKVPFEYLDQCINSIIHQTYENIEVIIVDDGSPKKWADKCDYYLSLDKRIRVIHQSNGGLSDARNKGLSVSKSKWITFVDGDDWIEEKFLEWFIERIQDEVELSDIYYFSGYRNYPQKQIEGVPYFEDGRKFVSYQERENLQTKCFTNHIAIGGNIKGITVSSAWAKVYNTSFLKKHNLLFPIVPYDEDSLFFLDTIEKASSIEYVAKSVYHYRFTQGSIVNRYRPNAIKEQEIYLGYIFEFINRYQKSDDFMNKAYMRVMTSMLLLIKQKFYHPENKESIWKRHCECRDCFKMEPYKTALKRLDFSLMRKNPRIKLILLKLHLYSLVEKSRRINQQRLILAKEIDDSHSGSLEANV